MVLKPSSDSEHNREALHFRLQHRSKKQEHAVKDKLEAQTGAKSGTSGSAETVLVESKGRPAGKSVLCLLPHVKRKMAIWLGQLATTASSGGHMLLQVQEGGGEGGGGHVCCERD